MRKNALGLPDTVLDTSFIGLVLSLSGWTILQAWLLATQASLRGHVLIAAAGIGLVVFSVRPAPLYATHPRSGRSGAVPWSALLLLAVGWMIGMSALAASTFVLLAVAGCLGLFPWRRLALCRQHFFTACSLVWAGAALTVFIGRDALSTMFLPLAGWVFWMCAGTALLLRTGSRSRLQEPARAE